MSNNILHCSELTACKDVRTQHVLASLVCECVVSQDKKKLTELILNADGFAEVSSVLANDASKRSLACGATGQAAAQVFDHQDAARERPRACHDGRCEQPSLLVNSSQFVCCLCVSLTGRE